MQVLAQSLKYNLTAADNSAIGSDGIKIPFHTDAGGVVPAFTLNVVGLR